MDGDGLSWSLGSTLTQSEGQRWNVLLRFMEINREGMPDLRHSLSPTPQEQIDVQVSHDRLTSLGRFYIGAGYYRNEDEVTGVTTSDTSFFLRWSLR